MNCVQTAPEKQSEEEWLAGVSDIHVITSRKVDTIFVLLISNSTPSLVKSMSSRRSSKSGSTNRSSLSFSSAKLRESLRAQREAILLVRQQIEEAELREEEESKLADF